MCTAALGSDTGGSIRQPASFTGTYGIKPTYGRISRFGLIAYASSFDQIGTFTNSLEDSALLLEVMAGEDEFDSTVSSKSVEKFSDFEAIGKLKIAVIKESFETDGIDPEVAARMDEIILKLEENGHTVEKVSFPYLEYIVPTYYVLTTAEASSNLARYDGVRYGFRSSVKDMTLDEMYESTRSEGFGDEVRRRLMIGTYVLSSGFYDAYFTKAQKVRRLIVNDFNNAFVTVDALLTPVTPTPAFSLDSPSIKDPIAMYLNDIFTIPASMAGLPCILIPGGLTSKKLPIGLQLITNRFEEDKLFRVASELERCINFNAVPGGF
jgi:aspartyl-tRNA(Asn)/glutamyl-tRNA(Gln) amidotransferase subunit A